MKEENENLKSEQNRKQGIYILVFGILCIAGFCCYGLSVCIDSDSGRHMEEKVGKGVYGEIEKHSSTRAVKGIITGETEEAGRKNVRDKEVKPVFAEKEQDDESAVPNEMGIVVVGGKTIRIPCKYADIKDDFEISDYNMGDLEMPMESQESLALRLVTDGVENGVRLRLRNDTEETLDRVEEADVVGIEVDEIFYGKAMEVLFIGNIKLGTDIKTLEAQLTEMEYEVEKEEDYTLYYAEYSQDEQSFFYFDIMTFEDKVVTIDLDYSRY
ncbi:MAG: hypothetical protein HFJ06_05235 [Lachnospiraceae bacterium]|nr:hypothetical protein [Lachnospiraceae bacterium]